MGWSKVGGKRMVTKSFSTVLGVEKNKKINTYLSTNIEIILDSFSMVYRDSVAKNEIIVRGFLIRGGGGGIFFFF